MINNYPQDRPPSLRVAVLQALLFIVSGMLMVLIRLPQEWRWRSWAGFAGLAFACMLVLPEIGFITGWVKGFPRWCFPYIGMMLFRSWYMMNTATPGLHIGSLWLFGRESWGLRAWMLPLLACVVGLLVTRFSPQPFVSLVRGVWDDWTRLSYAMYGAMPLMVWMDFDETHGVQPFICMLVLAGLLIGTALLYLQAHDQPWRVRVIMLGIFLTVFAAALGATLYWLPSNGVYVPGMAVLSSILVLIMLSPALIGLLHRFSARQSRPA